MTTKASDTIRNDWNAAIMEKQDIIDRYTDAIRDLEQFADVEHPATRELIADYCRRIAHAEAAIQEQTALRDHLVAEAERLEAQAVQS